MMDDVENRIAKSFASQGLMRSLDARLEHVSEGRVTISAPITEASNQQHGFAHAGLTFAIGDSASGYAALTQMEPDAEVLTVEMKINLIAPGDGVRLWAHGEVVKPGRRLLITRATVEVERADGSRRDIALLQGTMIPV
ncbi:hotdog fold thioesterase [Roseobacter sp. HKCCD9010]|nr:hotdog fold thioesterase [Rhodobacterales bacterium HKCCD4356]NNV11129.1 hotdog fold thioesterase [Roseobacter sp. HKCCD7357]NNV15313.1 hotdog fold thioesterase [Roseobacter sp. HKCCD8768]NNV24773.1 hotdog fold thioesterase [Roseobacter sp. HKCCD8192]NNV29029.1 hotdog fold thioesterase [Roseobacter sp. HKCCD9061]NNV33303.1 hotdog fold thioesterase [Roseobacter sp. HKCCD9073]NNV37553.1 hotdog fold thioesterase [Roseobacter sp. HKCCD9054]NNV41510.1 hotdog fold thioesterase [Roseobacter sp. 